MFPDAAVLLLLEVHPQGLVRRNPAARFALREHGATEPGTQLELHFELLYGHGARAFGIIHRLAWNTQAVSATCVMNMKEGQVLSHRYPRRSRDAQGGGHGQHSRQRDGQRAHRRQGVDRGAQAQVVDVALSGCRQTQRTKRTTCEVPVCALWNEVQSQRKTWTSFGTLLELAPT